MQGSKPHAASHPRSRPPQRHAFRWLYLLASLPFLWWCVVFVVRLTYVRIELAYFQELVSTQGPGAGKLCRWQQLQAAASSTP